MRFGDEPCGLGQWALVLDESNRALKVRRLSIAIQLQSILMGEECRE